MKASSIILLSIALVASMPMLPTEAASICLTYRDARKLWPRIHLWWFRDKQTGDRCWSNIRGRPPRNLKFDPVFSHHAEDKILPAPKLQAPLRSDEPLKVTEDGCCWPKLTEFDLRWAGVQ
jgi:hypothetical protein